MNKFVLFSIVLIFVLSKSCLGFMEVFENDERLKAIKAKVCIKNGLNEKQWKALVECHKSDKKTMEGQGHKMENEKMKKVFTECKANTTDIKDLWSKNKVHDQITLLTCSAQYKNCHEAAVKKDFGVTDEHLKAAKEQIKPIIEKQLDCGKKAVDSA